MTRTAHRLARATAVLAVSAAAALGAGSASASQYYHEATTVDCSAQSHTITINQPRRVGSAAGWGSNGFAWWKAYLFKWNGSAWALDNSTKWWYTPANDLATSGIVIDMSNYWYDSDTKAAMAPSSESFTVNQSGYYAVAGYLWWDQQHVAYEWGSVSEPDYPTGSYYCTF